MPTVKIDDLGSSHPNELTREQMSSLRGGTSELAKDPAPKNFCGTPVPSPFPTFDTSGLPCFDQNQFPWSDPEEPGPAGPCLPTERTTL